MATAARSIHLTNPLMRGADVKRSQTLMHKHGYFAGAIDGVAGPNTCHAYEISKFRLGYHKLDIKPTCGALLLKYLANPDDRPADYKRRSEARQGTSYVEFEEAATRSKIVAIAHWGIANNGKINYSQRRPIDGTNHPYELPLYIDCSGFVTLCYQWAGAPDPNGRGYDGLGYTGTLLNHCKFIMQEQAKLGDIVVWGMYPGHHTALVIAGPRSNPMLASHGKQSDPHAITFKDESRYQPSTVHWLRLPEWV